MKALPEAIAFAALVGGASWLEAAGRDTGGLWIVLVLWALFSGWGQKG